MDRIVLAGAAQPGTRDRQGLFRRNGGDWQRITAGLPDRPEIRFLTFVGERAYAGTQDGPYASDDGGFTWRSLNLPGDNRGTWSIQVRPDDPDTIFAGTTGTDVFRSSNAGVRWERLDVPVPDGHCAMAFPTRVIRIAVDPGAPDELYVGLEVGGVVRSLDGGETWESCNPDLLRLSEQDHLKSRIGSDMYSEGMMDTHSLAISPARPGTVFLATRMGLFRSDDRGETWKELPIGKFSPVTYARDIKVSSHDPERFFGAFSAAASSDIGALYRSTDFGATWSRFDHGVNINSTLMAIAESADNPDRVWCAARRGRIFGTEDGGASWEQSQLPDDVADVYGLAVL